MKISSEQSVLALYALRGVSGTAADRQQSPAARAREQEPERGIMQKEAAVFPGDGDDIYARLDTYSNNDRPAGGRGNRALAAYTSLGRDQELSQLRQMLGIDEYA